jgi:adenylate kinase family enzyme
MEPTENNKYHNAKIYKIVDKNFTKVYYGSTIKPLSQRLACHRFDYLHGKKLTSGILFEEFGVENCQIYLVKRVKCNNKEELNKIEGEYIQNNPCVNRYVAGRNEKEWRKQYNAKNNEKIRERTKLYRQRTADKRNENFDCECGSHYIHNHRARHFKTKVHTEYIAKKEIVI